MKIDFGTLQRKMGKKYMIGLCLVFGLLLFGMMYNNVRQESVNITEGNLASETIRANKLIENKPETAEKKRLAEEAIIPEYTFDKEISKKQVGLIKQLFGLVLEVNADAEKTNIDKSNAAKDKEKETIQVVSKDEKIAPLKKKFESVNQDDISFFQGFPNTFYNSLFDANDATLKIVRDESIKLVEKNMSEGIRSTTLESVRQAASDEVQYLNVSPDVQRLIQSVLDRGIVVNEAANEKRTAELRSQARDNVKPVMIYQGEVIIREGVQIDTKTIAKLELLGITNRAPSIFPIVALLSLILLQIAVLGYLAFTITDLERQVRMITFYVLTMTLSIIVMKALQVFQTEAYAFVPMLYPAAFTPLVLNLFINRRTSIIGALFQVAFSMFVFYDLAGVSSTLLIALAYMFTGLMPSIMKRERIGRQLGDAAIWLIVFPVLFVAVFTTYQGMDFTDSKTLSTILCALAGSVFSYVLSVGLHPYIELMLNDDSVLVLNELSNPNHPLLKKLLEEAPGTYHHSMMVANLSANAVADIGGRSLLTRVGCYYHDIGKIKHANFFVENLPDGAENPHNFLLPEDSKEIIFSHVSEGVKILEKEKMPQMVIDICQQHHGTTLMSFFYSKAKERNQETQEEEFRYPGPKPLTREAGVVSLADTCEAAVRAMDHPTNDKIREFVNNLIKNRLLDGQLDETGLTIKEIRIIEKSLINGLCSTFHSRIKYPKMKSEAEEMKKEQEARV